MSMTEEMIDATLEADGTLRLAHPPQLPAGAVRVLIHRALRSVARDLDDPGR